MSEQLKACPFCGSMPVVNAEKYNGRIYEWVHCINRNCAIVSEGEHYDDLSIELSDWNNRPIEDLLSKQLKVTMGALYKYRESGVNLWAAEAILEVDVISALAEIEKESER
jgi:hypothetical protein